MAKPTPTQEENDRAAMGEHVMDKEPDGSPPDPGAPPDAHGKPPEEGITGDPKRKAINPASSGQYQTRAHRPEMKTGSTD